MRRLGDPPKTTTLDKPATNSWFATVSERFGKYSGPNDPTLAEIPENQWIVYENTSSGIVGLWLNDNGVLKHGVISVFGGGSVTSVSVVTANGLAGSVATATTTPAITLSTTVTGMVKGNGTALSAAVAGTDFMLPNSAIVAATKTKITYDIRGLVTAGADATTADIADSSNKRYVTDANLVVINNTSGLNSGDQTNITGNAGTVTVANEATDATCFPLFATATSGSLSPKTNANLTFDSSTGRITLVAPVLGTPTSGNLANCTFPTLNQNTTGSAAKWTTPRAIYGNNVDGSADVTGPVTVAFGGTGRATSTTAYGLLAAGTTATGAHQTLAAGATTEVLVGGGAAALPVWTTATGSGAPVRATAPSMSTPTVTDTLIVTNNAPSIRVIEEDQAANSKRNVIASSGGGIIIQEQDDAGSATRNVLVVTRGGVLTFGGNMTTAGTILTTNGGVGYGTGAGGAVAQATNRTTGVTINKISGSITLFSQTNTAISQATAQSFTVTNSAVAATDVVIVNQKSGTDKYEIFVTNVSGGSFQITNYAVAGTTNEAPVFNFAVIKAVAS
jgi:hypothetical protein